MRIDAIELFQVGRFHGSVRVGPFQPAVNVLAAPNEQGKSTLIRAAARCLFDRHTTRTDEIRALQPVGTELAPTITVEFSTRTGRHKISKRFLINPESTLFERRGDAWVTRATADRADSLLIEMLEATQPGRGASKPEHWGLFRYLWARQDQPAEWPGWEGAPGETIRRSLARVQLEDGLDAVLERLSAENLAAFTPTGQVRKAGVLAPALEREAALRSQLQEITQRLSEMEQHQDRYRTLSEKVTASDTLARSARQEADRLTLQAQQLEQQTRDLNQATKALDEANTRLQAAQRELDQLTTAQSALRAITPTLASLAAQRTDLAAKETALANDLKTLETEALSLETLRADTTRRLQRLKDRVRWHEEQKARTALQDRLQAARTLAEERKDIELRAAGLPVISPTDAETFAALETAIQGLRLQLETTGLKLQLNPAAPGTVRFTNEQGTRDLDPATEPNLFAIHRLALEIPGWGSLTVSSGATESQSLASSLEKKLSELDDLRRRLGVQSAAAARETVLLLRSIEQEKATLQRRSRLLLPDGETEATLTAALASADARIRQLEGASPNPPDPALPLSAEDAHVQLVAAEAELQTLTERITRLGTHQRRLHADRQGLATKLAALAQEQEQARLSNERLTTQIRAIEERHPNGPATSLTLAQVAFVQAEARVASAKASLPPDAAAIPGRRDRAIRATQEAETARAEAKAAMDRLEGALGANAAAGLHTKATELMEELAAETALIETLRTRALAARLAAALIQRRKSLAVRTVLGPLERRLTAAFATLTGVQNRSVYLDEHLAVAGIGDRADAGSHIPFECLSQGAREQLLLALRAAVALELSTIEPQTLVLDDVLVHTDATRQQRVLDFLTDLGRSVQILVLTCHPERYAGVGHPVALTESA